ncbi:MAG: hypothetical protein RLZZ324_647 [Candidatus Parcubacteria bacterium]|jgi:hypothetical protein
MEPTQLPPVPPTPDQRLAAMEATLAEVAVSVRKIRAYMFWTGVATLVFFVLPLIGTLFAIPYIIKTYAGLYSGL